MWDHSLRDLFLRGGGVMWPLLACSCIALAVAIERLLVIVWRTPSYEGFVRWLDRQLSQHGPAEVRRRLNRKRGVLVRVGEEYIARADEDRVVRDEAVTLVASQQVNKLERRLHWLSVIGHLTPMLGLLGTVMGLVEAFHQIEVVGGQVQPDDLAAGIWKALLTTVFGLIIALPTLAVYHFLDHRVAAAALKMQWLTAHLNNWNAGRLGARPAQSKARQEAPPRARSEEPLAVEG